MDQCEICSEILTCDSHHIHSLSKGGNDTTYNRCKICPNCHRKVHTGVIIIEGNFRTTNGISLVWRNKGEESITGMVDPLVWIYGSKQI